MTPEELEELREISDTFSSLKQQTSLVVSHLAQIIADQARDAKIRLIQTIVILLAIGGFLLYFNHTVNVSRGRSACVEAITTNYNTKFADAIAVSVSHPNDRTALQPSIDALEAAHQLQHKIPELCYTSDPNPDPVPH